MTRRRQFLSALTGATVAGLAGCGYRPGGGDIRWSEDLSIAAAGIGSGITTADVVGDRLIAVVDSSRTFDFDSSEFRERGLVYAFETDSGTRRWRDELPEPVRVRALGDPPAVGTEHAVYGYGEGGERWEFEIGSAPLGIAAGGERVYVRTDAGKLRSIRRGRQQWTLDVPASQRHDAAVAADHRGVVYRDGDRLRRVDRDGSRQWNRPVPSETGDVRIVDDLLFVSTHRETVAVEVASGRERWRSDARLEAVDVTDRGVCVVSDERVTAVDHAGERRWRVGGESGGIEAGMGGFTGIVADETAVYVTSADSIFELDPTDGSVRWTVSHDTVSAGPFRVDSGVLVLVDDRLVCHHPD
ncbi:outer membrane protein assembly factor BamB family protein [Halapricum hydrolyticum]|uniref:PQQ-binding-like beta-propeller repeat protein n=1 Tax=Halapricum hydrolyticum TaxID=2979991 RepID=A0AAE3IH06_9EURY|nr:PQQ-binding-like beta-propeller repeat protein [Halapricum hydrolyticum]MCU4719330.1 PQQ-binding-like beta-propeller repeat protein [Halapricum hydrolyticum]MCU4728225.1 PQQ-binding-like beta-propeller repeat protein [Halapricum hydrolyticum]